MGSRKLNVVVLLLCSLVAVLGFGMEVTARSTQELIAISHIGAGENHKTCCLLLKASLISFRFCCRFLNFCNK